MGSDLKKPEIVGEFIGLWKVNKIGATQVLRALDKLSTSKDFKSMTCADLFNEIAKDHTIAVKYISGAWLDVDTLVDFQNAGNFVFNNYEMLNTRICDEMKNGVRFFSVFPVLF